MGRIVNLIGFWWGELVYVNVKLSSAAFAYYRTTVWMVLFVVLFGYASWNFATFLSEREFAERRRQIDSTNRNMARVLTENIDHAFSEADIILRFMKIVWEEQGLIASQYQKLLNEITKPGIITHIGVADSSGNLVFNGVKLQKPANISDREYFQAHMAKDAPTMFVFGTPVSRVTGLPTLYLSRRVNGMDGAFAGIVLVGLNQQYLLQVFREMELNVENSISLLHTNGSLLARAPDDYDPKAFATFFQKHPSLALVQKGACVGEYEVPGVDGIPRIGSFRLLPGYPVIALATTKREIAFSDVISRQDLYQNGAMGFSAIIGFYFLMLWMQMRQQYRTELTLRAREKELAFAGYHDKLTQIYNRTYFYERIKVIGRSAAIITGDLDGLKMINDTFGHENGDQALIMTAQLLNASVPADAVVARMGGDEFAILLPKATGQEVDAVCCSIRLAVEQYNRTIRAQTLPLQISLGFALAEEGTKKAEEMLETADKWMYREKLRQSHSRRSQLTKTLKEMLAARDFITEGHTSRVAHLSVSLAKAVGVMPARIADLELFAHFHDIGKIGISDTILNKPGLLTDDERHEMQQHTEIGHRIAKATDDLAPIADWILKHHERWDGKGYPWGIAGTDIPIECRILSITDSYDAMTSDRPYQKAQSIEMALQEIRDNAGFQFDPDLTEKFELVIKEEQELARQEET